MKLLVPYDLGDLIMTSGRKQGCIKGISGTITEKGYTDLRYDNANVTRCQPINIKGYENIKKEDYKTIRFNIPYEIGQEVFYQNSSYNDYGTLAKSKIIAIEFSLFNGGGVFWYRFEGRPTTIDSYNIYSSLEDFKQRTNPKNDRPLQDNERYLFTSYAIRQNRSEIVTFKKKTEVHNEVTSGYERGEKLRSSKFFTSKEKFYNKMFGSLDLIS